ncbi:MAG TPA: cupin domain-containing protein [Spirochaetota bacterium]|nr:cupin domain-containing protein [Spirochaetota bacterium]
MKADLSKIITSTGMNENDSWNPHPSFDGVYMRNLITSKDSGGKISCHIVRLEPGAELKPHMHEGKSETHEVLAGSGIFNLAGSDYSYEKGVAAFIPEDTIHSVKAGNDGIILLAKFVPPLN